MEDEEIAGSTVEDLAQARQSGEVEPFGGGPHQSRYLCLGWSFILTENRHEPSLEVRGESDACVRHADL
jgi:hypothetical protein